MTGRESRDAAHAASVVVGLSIVVLLLGTLRYQERRDHPGLFLADPSVEPFWGPARLNSYVSCLVSQYDSSAQMTAYRVALLGSASAVLAAVAAGLCRRAWRLPSWLPGLMWSVAAGLSSGILWWCLRRARSPSWQPRKREVLLIAVLLTTLAWAWPRLVGQIRRGGWNKVLAIAAAASIALAVLPSVLLMPDLSAMSRFNQLFSGHHYATRCSGQADRLAAGQVLFDEVKPHYGLLFQLVLAGCQRHLRPLSLGETIQVLSLVNGIYLTLCALLFRRLSRARWALVVLGLALLVPSYHFAHLSLLFPNQAAWRTLFFPLALGCAWWSAGRGRAWSGFTFGVVGGLALLWNLESGIAATAGLGACLLFSSGLLTGRARASDLVPFLTFPFGLLLSFLMFLVAWRSVLGNWPHPRGFLELYLSVLTRAGAGFGGLRYGGAITPVGLFGWSAYVLVDKALASRPIRDSAGRVRVCAAGISLIWLGYYFNRPASWNLSSYGILLAVPTIDACRRIALAGTARRLLRPSGLAAWLFVAAVSLPGLYSAVALRHENTLTMCADPRIFGQARSGPDRTLLSGVMFDRHAAQSLEDKAAYLRRHANGLPSPYIARDSYLIPKLSGVQTSLPFGDLLADSVTESNYLANLSAVYRQKDDLLVERVEPTDPYYDGFYAQFLADLTPTFEPIGRQAGWEFWAKNHDDVTKKTPAHRGVPKPVGQRE